MAKTIDALSAKTSLATTDVFMLGDEGSSTLKKVTLENLKNAICKIMYPVGSIYESTSATNPSTFLGGTWELYGKGRVSVCVDADDTDYSAASKTGGSKTASYTPTGTIGGTTLTASNLPSHDHTVGQHNHSVAKHSHSIPALTGTTAGGGSHTHAQYYAPSFVASGSARASILYDYASASQITGAKSHSTMATIANHTHTFSTTATNTGELAAFTTGNSASSLKTGKAYGKSDGTASSHTHTFTGTAKTLNIRQPYITLYRWKRTAL